MSCRPSRVLRQLVHKVDRITAVEIICQPSSRSVDQAAVSRCPDPRAADQKAQT